jgi:hypothetical protein
MVASIARIDRESLEGSRAEDGTSEIKIARSDLESIR